jgi:hypothetical protein
MLKEIKQSNGKIARAPSNRRSTIEGKQGKGQTNDDEMASRKTHFESVFENETSSNIATWLDTSMEM